MELRSPSVEDVLKTTKSLQESASCVKFRTVKNVDSRIAMLMEHPSLFAGPVLPGNLPSMANVLPVKLITALIVD